MVVYYFLGAKAPNIYTTVIYNGSVNVTLLVANFTIVLILSFIIQRLLERRSRKAESL